MAAFRGRWSGLVRHKIHYALAAPLPDVARSQPTETAYSFWPKAGAKVLQCASVALIPLLKTRLLQKGSFLTQCQDSKKQIDKYKKTPIMDTFNIQLTLILHKKVPFAEKVAPYLNQKTLSQLQQHQIWPAREQHSNIGQPSLDRWFWGVPVLGVGTPFFC